MLLNFLRNSYVKRCKGDSFSRNINEKIFSGKVGFLWILQNFRKHLFLQNTSGDSFWTFVPVNQYSPVWLKGLTRLFSFFWCKNVSARNVCFTNKPAKGNKRKVGLTSKYQKRICVDICHGNLLQWSNFLQ